MSSSVSMIDGHIDEVCPCNGCEIRKAYAKAWDLHWMDGDDCPYVCPKYDEWKERSNT